jgi:hypothetical protein
MTYIPVKDPVTGMITMVKAVSRGVPAAALWTSMVGAPIPSDDMPEGERAEALDAIALAVFGSGYTDGAVGSAIEMCADAGDRDDQDRIEAILEGYVTIAMEAHARVAAGWVGDTDNDRLTRAFWEMESVGIVTRENLGQSMSDGEHEIDAIVDLMISDGKEVRGNVFYHEQDVERALGGQGLNLAFTGDRTGAEAARLIGHEIVAILERNGLKPVWNGDPDHRIKVDMEWRRRP